MKQLLIRLLEMLVASRPNPNFNDDVKWDALDGAEFSVILPTINTRPSVDKL